MDPTPAPTRPPVPTATVVVATPSPAPSAAATPVATPVLADTPPPTPTPPPLVNVPTPSHTPAPSAPDGVLTTKQIALHREAATRLGLIVEETFAEIRRALLAGEKPTEAGVVAFVSTLLARDKLVTEKRPLVSAGPNGSYPDHPGGTDQVLATGQVLLVEIVAKKDDPDGVYARTTWTAFAGKKVEVPARVEKVWKMVRDAREAAISRAADRVAAKKAVSGDDVDVAARTVIKRAKHGPWFQHSAGVSLGATLPGAGLSLSTGEKRAIAADTCYALRPAVYYPAEFGVRTEISFCVTGGAFEITTGIRQREIRPLLD